MTTERNLTAEEEALIAALLANSSKKLHYMTQIGDAKVLERSGDKMVLEFRLPQYENPKGTGYEVVAEGFFVDERDTPEVFALLFVDDNDRLFELEVYRADGSKLTGLPSLSKLKPV